jgi:hypothetical protein
MMDYRSRLGESQTLQDFSRDAEEIEAWIADKLAAASDEPVKETQNLQVRIKFLFEIFFASFTIVHNKNKKTWKYI